MISSVYKYQRSSDLCQAVQLIGKFTIRISEINLTNAQSVLWPNNGKYFSYFRIGIA